jgi:chitodextrinase
MKQVNFSNSGGFPLEQETLERLQTAYRSELYEALKRHFSIDLANDYILAHATIQQKGWAVIRQEDPVNPGNNVGILHPITIGTQKPYLKTTRTAVNLIYGTSASQTAYYDYEAEYSSQKYNDEVVVTKSGDVQTIKYYDVSNLVPVTDIKTIDEILKAINSSIDAIQANINTIEEDINLINESYLPINGSKAMQGDLDLGTHQLSKLDIKEGGFAKVRVADFRLGSAQRKGLLNPTDSTGRALVDSSDQSNTSLTLNYGPDWTNTYVGGKVYLNNINSSNSTGSLLVIDGLNQVTKSDTLIDSLLSRITALENKPAIAVPIGMVAIWGKPAPFPEGWEEYRPLRGKMPVGLFNPTLDEMSDELDGDRGNNVTYYRDSNGMVVFPFDTLGNTGGRVGKNLRINEMPRHTHDYNDIYFSEHWGSVIVPNNVGTGDNDGDNKGYQMLRTSFPTGGTDGGAIGSATPFSLLNPYRVVQFIEYTGRPSDKTAPTAPTLMASSIGTTSVSLNWSGATDEFGVTDYIVYGNAISPISVGNVFNRTIYGLAPGTSYTFYVKAKDEAGNVSVDSNIVTVTTTIPSSDTTPPNEPEIASTLYNHILRINLSWSIPYDNVGVTEYELWRSEDYNDFVLISTQPSTAYADFNIYYGSSYYYKVRARDAAGNWSNFSNTTSETPIDPSPQCFDVESLVTMASGQSKKLKNVVVGDQLQGFSFPNEVDESEGDYLAWTGKLNEASKATVTVINKKTALVNNYYEITAQDGTVVKVTGEHSLLTTQDGVNVQWLRTKNVVNSMSLIDKTGKIKTIESIIFKEEPLEVAVLDVESVDNYVIAGIVAHNAPIRDEVIAK